MREINLPETGIQAKKTLGGIQYKWIVLSVTTIGALMAAIDANIVILALPEMMKSLHADLVQMIWVIISYILISTVTFSAGGVLGPVLGGLILAAASWRWIFFINVPIGILGTAWSVKALRELSPRVKGERFDAPGALAFSLGLLALAMAVAAANLPRDDMMRLFVGTSIAMGSSSMQSFVVGMRGAFTVSLALSLVAALLSFLRGQESRRARADEGTIGI